VTGCADEPHIVGAGSRTGLPPDNPAASFAVIVRRHARQRDLT
jgi:hypothetical protein